MRLYDDVRLIGVKIWLSARSSTRALSQQILNSAILETSSVIVWLEATAGRKLGEINIEVEVKILTPSQ